MLNFLPLLILEAIIVALGSWFSIAIIRAASHANKLKGKLPDDAGEENTAHNI
jgi:hypothetical protein